MYKLNNLNKALWGEIAHHFDQGDTRHILSSANIFHIKTKNHSGMVRVPNNLAHKLLSKCRIVRRLLRLDKSNAVFNYSGDGVVIIYRSKVYYYDLNIKKLTQTAAMKNCRNVLHQSICVTENAIFIGEYGANSDRVSVPVWRSIDDGKTWGIIYEFPAGSIKHTHGVYEDPFTGKIWIPTGDADGECSIVVANKDFELLETLGDGTQQWRPISFFFTHDKVIWGMDSPLNTSTLQIYDRSTKILTAGQSFPGPVWHTKTLTNGTALLQTTVEPGPAVTSNFSHIYVSDDLLNWEPVLRVKKDRWPMIFKFGVLAFCDGAQSEKEFLIFGEALSDFDGVIKCYSLQQNEET